MHLIVFSAFAPVRTALAGLAAEEGARPVAAESLHDCISALEHFGQDTLVLLDAMHDPALAEAFLPIAETQNVRVALLSGRPSEHLRHHPAVRYHLEAPFPATVLRTFLRSLTATVPGQRPVSGTRQRSDLAFVPLDDAADGTDSKKRR